MYQALEKPGCSVASLCSGPENRTGSVGENKKTIGKPDFFFIGALLISSAGLSSRFSSRCRLMDDDESDVEGSI